MPLWLLCGSFLRVPLRQQFLKIVAVTKCIEVLVLLDMPRVLDLDCGALPPLFFARQNIGVTPQRQKPKRRKTPHSKASFRLQLRQQLLEVVAVTKHIQVLVLLDMPRVLDLDCGALPPFFLHGTTPA